MTLSQYQLTETDNIDFESIMKELNIPPVAIKYNEKNKLKIREVKKVSSSLKK
jgi:hypothetical protein